MDPGRINAYLQASCAGLGFDIGEVWFSSGDKTDRVNSLGECASMPLFFFRFSV